VPHRADILTGMAEDRGVRLGTELGTKRVFAWVIDWPGWCRAGRSVPLAVTALIDHRARYERAARLAGLALPTVTADDLVTAVTVAGGSGTDFGVPSAITDDDRRPTTTAEAARLADLVTAAWEVFDDIVAAAPAELRKGPRGGGRDRDKVVEHVVGADHAYAREIGLTGRPPEPGDRLAVEAERAAMLDVLRTPSDGSPLAGRKWPLRYAARRIAWHALDHAWEIEDRSEPTS
jgi:hypothetical protein